MQIPFAREMVMCSACWLVGACASASPSSDTKSALAAKIDFSTEHCERVSVQQLWDNPWPYGEKRVCVSGYLGHMIPYGEESADLFATAEDAKLRQSVRYVTLSVPLTIDAQEELARYSDTKLDAVGTFHFDERCWPQHGEKEASYQCFPPRPMKLLNAKIAVAQ